MNQDIQDFLERMEPKVRDNLRVFSREDSGAQYMLHIATDKVKELPTNISRRAGMQENNTVPRICCSDSLMGCIVGAANVSYLAINTAVGEKRPGGRVYKGGFYIYQIPFDYVFAPNKKLVYDQELSNELWLCTYDAQTATYPLEVAGELYVDEVSTVPRTNKEPAQNVTVHVKVYPGKSLPLNSFVGIDDKRKLENSITVQEGCYQLSYWEVDSNCCNDKVEIKRIQADEYEKNKGLKAGLLSLESLKPLYTKW